MASIPVPEIDQALGQWMRTIRVHTELTQADVAADLNDIDPTLRWTQSTVSKIEAGKRCLYTHELIALAAWSGMDLNRLLASVSPPRRSTA